MNNKLCDIIYPEQFFSEEIMAHIEQINDLKKILENSGYTEEFKRKYRVRLKFLNDKRFQCVLKKDWFESIKNESNLYSMKIKGTLNIRVLFCFHKIGNRQLILLLCSFHEKTTKDYKPAISLAYTRLKELL